MRPHEWRPDVRAGTTLPAAMALITATVLVISSSLPASAQTRGGTPLQTALTPADYIEIRQLVARYAYALDSGADKGQAYAALFAPDGAFAGRDGRETTGREALAELARKNMRGPQSAFHFIVNHIIDPVPGGAVGKQFLLQLRIGDGDRPNDIFGGGHYEDVYVKTPEGWRFKRRQYFPSEGSARPVRTETAR